MRALYVFFIVLILFWQQSDAKTQVDTTKSLEQDKTSRSMGTHSEFVADRKYIPDLSILKLAFRYICELASLTYLLQLFLDSFPGLGANLVISLTIILSVLCDYFGLFPE